MNFKSIIPKAITAADKHTFEAIRKGNLTILIPNGSSITHILPCDILYASKMGIVRIRALRDHDGLLGANQVQTR